MTPERRKAIPAGVARQLRQEAGFGCCKCGLPILQYHHIVEWTEDQHYRPEDMMVLCPTHHDQATKGAMPVPEQRLLKTSPFNIERGFARGLLEIKQDYCAADFGSITMVGEGVFLSINGESVVSFYLGEKNLEISLKLFSETDELLVEIERNEWVSGDSLPWDIQADWQVLTLREKARQISLSLNAKLVPMQILGEFWRAGNKIGITKDGIKMGARFSLQELALVGMRLELDTNNLSIGQQPEHKNATIISWHNRRERLWKAKEAWNRIRPARLAIG
jgi:hypothetical protein